MFSPKRLALGIALAMACIAPAAAQYVGPLNPSAPTSLSVSATSSALTLPASDGQDFLINTGGNTAYIAYAATATTSGFPLGPGCAIPLAPYGATLLAAVTASGVTTLTVAEKVFGTATMPPTGCAATLSQLNPLASTQEEISASGGNAVETATLPAEVGYTEYVCGATFTASGATSGLAVAPTITGLTNTLTYAFDFPAGVLVGAQPLVVTFSPCIPASATDTAINAILPAGGSGNTQESASIWGYYK